jgi:hypothetical protein
VLRTFVIFVDKDTTNLRLSQPQAVGHTTIFKSTVNG